MADNVELQLHRKPVHTVFDLLGDKENDMSFSIGWGLAKCPSLMAQTLKLLGVTRVPSSAVVRLQEADPLSGITDLEIESAGEFHVIIEAKRGWNLPTELQLSKYAERLRRSPARVRKLVVLSECSRDFARPRLASMHLDGIELDAVSWQDLANAAAEAQGTPSQIEKRVLRELREYLGGLVKMRSPESNWTYVVVLSRAVAEGWGISFLDVVLKLGKYAHPLGAGGWPKEPPNYIAFRYDGKLQSIHRVEDYEVTTNTGRAIPGSPDGERELNVVYTLGPAFSPAHDVPTGRVYPNGRVWCMLDTLFTSATIAEARDISQARSQPPIR